MASSASLRIVSLQTVVPTRMTEHARPRSISLADGQLCAEALQSRLRLVLYYRRSGEEDHSARKVAAWTKESLGMALSEHPVLAGRLRKLDREGYWEVKPNDAGVRLAEAKAEITMEEVLGSKERDGWEAKLCYWQDVDAENPKFSALLCVQVTEFQNDGYSIGVSCSLLLADPLFLTKFLKEWALIHNQMLSQGKLSIFHLGNFQDPGQHAQTKSDMSYSSSTTTTVFKVLVPPVVGTAGYNTLLAHCLEETSTRLKRRMVQEWSLLVNDHSGDMEVKSFTKDELTQAQPNQTFDGTVHTALCDDFGLKKMALSEGNKPIYVSYRIVSSQEQGIAVTMPASSREEGDYELLISVTVPNKI